MIRDHFRPAAAVDKNRERSIEDNTSRTHRLSSIFSSFSRPFHHFELRVHNRHSTELHNSTSTQRAQTSTRWKGTRRYLVLLALSRKEGCHTHILRSSQVLFASSSLSWTNSNCVWLATIVCNAYIFFRIFFRWHNILPIFLHSPIIYL